SYYLIHSLLQTFLPTPQNFVFACSTNLYSLVLSLVPLYSSNPLSLCRVFLTDCLFSDSFRSVNSLSVTFSLSTDCFVSLLLTVLLSAVCCSNRFQSRLVSIVFVSVRSICLANSFSSSSNSSSDPNFFARTHLFTSGCF